jgi:hypothetical protein
MDAQPPVAGAEIPENHEGWNFRESLNLQHGLECEAMKPEIRAQGVSLDLEMGGQDGGICNKVIAIGRPNCSDRGDGFETHCGGGKGVVNLREEVGRFNAQLWDCQIGSASRYRSKI